MMFWDPNPLVDAEEAKKKEDAGSGGGGVRGGDSPMTGAPQQPQQPRQPQQQQQQVEAKPGRPSRRTMLGRLRGRSKMVSSRHLGGVKKNPLAGAEEGDSEVALERTNDDGDCSFEDADESARTEGTATAAGAASAAKTVKSKSSVSPSVPHTDSPWQRMRASSGKGKSIDESGGAGGTSGTSGAGSGDDGISEGVESKRPDLMVTLVENRLNRTGSVEINGGGGGDGEDGGAEKSRVASMEL